MSLAPARKTSEESIQSLPSPPQPIRLRRLLGVTAGHFLNDFHMAWLSPLLPLLVVRFDLSLALAGLLATVLNTSSAFSQPFFGLAADRVRRSVFVAIGPVLTVAAMSLTGVTPSYGMLLVVLVVAGAGTALFHPQGAASASFFSGSRRGTGLSIFVAGGELAYALGPLYIAALVQWQGLGATLPAGLPGIIGAVAVGLAVRAWVTAPPGHRETLGADLSAQRRPLFLLWLYVVVRGIASSAFLTFLPLFLRERGLSLVMGGTAVFLFGGIGAFGGVLGGVLADRIGRRAIMGLSVLLAAPLLALYLQVPVGWGLLLLPVAGIVLYASAPVTIVMGQEILHRHHGVASSIVMGLAWGTSGLALTPIGAAADAFGLKTTLMALLGILLLGALPLPALSPPNREG